VNITPKLQEKVNADRAKAGIWAWKCTEAMNSYDVVPDLKKITIPSLLIYGEADAQRGKESDLHNYIKGSQVAIIPNAGHLPQVDNPQGFLEAVQPFLK